MKLLLVPLVALLGSEQIRPLVIPGEKLLFKARAFTHWPARRKPNRRLRHEVEARNPVRDRSLPAVFDGYDVVERIVPDRRQKSGASGLRFYLKCNEKKIPVCIESSIP